MIRRRGETAREAPGWHLNRVLLRNLTRGQQAQAHIIILNEAETRRELASFLSSRVSNSFSCAGRAFLNRVTVEIAPPLPPTS